MRRRFFLMTVIFIWTFHLAFSQQHPEKEAIKFAIQIETVSFMKRDSIIWKEQFIQNEVTNRDFFPITYSESQVGWQNIGPMMLQWMPQTIPLHNC